MHRKQKVQKCQHRQLGRTLIGNQMDSFARVATAAAADAEDNVSGTMGGTEQKKKCII